jgi:cytochrome c oxidase subunit III
MATQLPENYPYDPATALGTLLEEPEPTLSMPPKRFALWLFIVSIIMIFASMTSAYIVRKGEGNWLDYELPPILWWSTGVLMVSSFTVQMAWLSAKKDELTAVKVWMFVTMALSLVFLYMQWESWVRLVQINVYLVGNPSGSFLYILTGLHAFHLLTGITYLAIVTVMAFRFKIHRTALLDMELAATYWHFLDFLWVALFAFLVWNHSV